MIIVGFQEYDLAQLEPQMIMIKTSGDFMIHRDVPLSVVIVSRKYSEKKHVSSSGSFQNGLQIADTEIPNMADVSEDTIIKLQLKH